MSIISAGDTGGLDLPEISNSLRFDGTNDYIEKVLSVSGSTTTFVDSIHIKRSDISTARRQSLMYKGNSGGTGNLYYVEFKTDDKLYIFFNSAGTYYFVSDSVFRDPSAWLHLVVAIDTTQAISSNRVKVYLNGSVLTSTSAVYPPQNHAIPSTSGNVNRFSLYSTFWFGGYAANYCCVDGYPTGVNQSNWESINFSALFAYTDPNGQWRSLSKTALQSVVNAGGAASFFLPFDGGSSTTTLGNDASSKGNNWTLTNMVRTGGVDDCWSYDTPTNNFATLNPLDSSGTNTVSAGNLTYITGATFNLNRSTFALTAGKWYWEVTGFSGIPGVGVSRTDVAVTNSGHTTANGWAYFGDTGNKWTNNSGAAYGAAFSGSDVIGIALDMDNGTLTFYKNNVSQGVAFSSGLLGNSVSPMLTSGLGASGGSFTFGQRPVASGQWYPDAGGYFRYAPPTGYKALSTKNLPGGAVTTSGTFTGNVAAEGPFVWLNGTPTAMTINGNAVTFGTHADKLANGFKLRTASTSYNNSGSNTYSVTSNAGAFKYNNAEGNP